MKEKNRKKEVRLLAKHKEFEQIYLEYGPKYFRKYVTHKYKKRDIKTLMQEGKYIDIYVKYGKDYWEKALLQDVGNELGRELTLKETICFDRKFMRIIVFSFVMSVVGTRFIPPLWEGPIETEIEKAQNAKKYAKEIEEYKNKIKEYAEKFDIHSQSDMEIIMRMIKDMHETIKGFGDPKIDATGYRGMDVMDEDGIGVCRNMSENLVDKFNEINLEYNARIVTLYMKSGGLIKANIEHNTIEENVRKNVNDGVNKIYVDEQLEETTIKEDDTQTKFEYDEGTISKKIIKTANQEERIIYDKKGEIIQYRKILTEKNGDSEILKTYIDGKLASEEEQNPIYYKKTNYDENGQVRSQKTADERSDKTDFFENGKVICTLMIQDNYLTKINYNNQGEEIKREKEETDRTNIFVERKNSEKKLKELEKKNEQEENEKIKQGKINHAIVAIDIKKDHITLLIDPTNLSIGIFKDGKIHIFNETNPEKAIYNRSWKGDSNYKGIKGITDYPIDYIKSFLEPTLTMEELEEKYGLEAQNKMLEKIEKEDNKKDFKEQLQIGTGITYDFNRNVVTVDNTERREEKEQR